MLQDAQAEHASTDWTALAATLVEERSIGRTDDAVAVVCPAARHGLEAGAMRHVACCAVLRTAPDAVWMLRTVGCPWTEERLAAAVDRLSQPLGHLPLRRDPMLATRLARALELPQVQVLSATLDRPDPAQWDTRRLALAARLNRLPPGGSDPHPAALATEVQALERALVERLGAALYRFVNSLDAEVLAVAPQAAHDAGLYGYLADPRHRRNRLQLAATLPLFLRAAARGEAHGTGGLIRRLVDEGAPLVKELAARWAVAPSVLRGLCAAPVELIGARWEANPEALVALLDLLPAEHRPGADPTEWRAFNGAVAFAESVFGRHTWSSPLTLAWLRRAARSCWNPDVADAGRDELPPEGIAWIDELRQALTDALRANSAGGERPLFDDVGVVLRAGHVADGFLAGLAPKRLVALAQRYRRELATARAQHRSAVAFANGAGYWPLLPGEYRSRDGARVVVPLTNRPALRAQGRAVDNCLGGSHLSYYAAVCGSGDAFVVALLDAATRTPLSTAELRLRRLPLEGRLDVRVAQHTAARNAPPSDACRDALAEAIALLATDGGQAHLRRGVPALADRRRGDARLRREVEAEAVRQALATTLGERRFDELSARVGRPARR